MDWRSNFCALLSRQVPLVVPYIMHSWWLKVFFFAYPALIILKQGSSSLKCHFSSDICWILVFCIEKGYWHSHPAISALGIISLNLVIFQIIKMFFCLCEPLHMCGAPFKSYCKVYLHLCLLAYVCSADGVTFASPWIWQIHCRAESGRECWGWRCSEGGRDALQPPTRWQSDCHFLEEGESTGSNT